MTLYVTGCLPFLLQSLGSCISPSDVPMNIQLSRFRRRRFGFTACGVATLAHILVLVFSMPFFFVPEGSYIRPMGWTAMVFMIAVGTFVIAVPAGVIAIKKERPCFIGILGVVLGLTPFLLAGYMLHFASWFKGFHLSP